MALTSGSFQTGIKGFALVQGQPVEGNGTGGAGGQRKSPETGKQTLDLGEKRACGHGGLAYLAPTRLLQCLAESYAVCFMSVGADSFHDGKCGVRRFAFYQAANTSTAVTQAGRLYSYDGLTAQS
jgi:hypothetical protein